MHDSKEDDRLCEYFDEIARNGHCWGVLDGKKLVSVTDTPSVPYMADKVVELGINTLPGYRRKGYAQAVCGAMLRYVLGTGKTPIWSCGGTNTASMRLAETLGFRKFADVLSVTLKD